MDETTEAGPQRPSKLDFLRIKDPGKPVSLAWDAPGGDVAGYIVYATENRFPPQMAGPLFEGKMRQFIDEERLDRGVTEYRVARGEAFYAVIWFDVDDNYYAVTGLREPEMAREVLVDIAAFPFTQARTYLRVKFVPPPVPMRDSHVDLYIRDVEPNAAALNRMAAGELNPDFVLQAKGDGFIDTVTDQEWRKYYTAVSVGKDGVRRPMELKAGAYQRVEEPQYLARDGKRLCDQLMEKVRDQIELELQRRSVTAEDMGRMLKRADDLSPFNPMVERLRRKARDRFGD
ncbi:MAG: hypothetical protein EP329_23825 [Deltaproteobacteria bacterium]|nr:MAG: hypothetical protein EP329_23825 [Deltaproteobacteria bacterium]